jgi:hypothetical protein
MLEKLYQEAWKMGFKISLAVIPKIAADIIPGRYVASRGLRYTPMVPPNVRGKHIARSIAENKELVQYLLSKVKENKVQLLLHGLEHQRVDGAPEFSSRKIEQTRKRVKEAEEIFKKTFGLKPRVFVPPWELLSVEAREMLREMEYHLCRRYPRFLDEYLESFSRGYYPVPFKRRPIILLKDLGSNSVSFKSGIFDLRDNGYFFSMLYDAETSRKASKEIFLRNLENWNASIWCNHYWEFFFDWQREISMNRIFENFNEFLRFVSRFNIWKCGLEDLAEWLRKYHALRIQTRDYSLKIEAMEPMSNLAIRSDKHPKVLGEKTRLVEIEEGVYLLPKVLPKEKIEISTQI